MQRQEVCTGLGFHSQTLSSIRKRPWVPQSAEGLDRERRQETLGRERQEKKGVTHTLFWV